MKVIKVIILSCIFLSSGCGVMVQRITGPHPATYTFHISCSGDLASCYYKAGELCPTGYSIVGQDSADNVGIFLGGLSRHRGELIVECNRKPNTQSLQPITHAFHEKPE